MPSNLDKTPQKSVVSNQTSKIMTHDKFGFIIILPQLPIYETGIITPPYLMECYKNNSLRYLDTTEKP